MLKLMIVDVVDCVVDVDSEQHKSLLRFRFTSKLPPSSLASAVVDLALSKWKEHHDSG